MSDINNALHPNDKFVNSTYFTNHVHGLSVSQKRCLKFFSNVASFEGRGKKLGKQIIIILASVCLTCTWPIDDIQILSSLKTMNCKKVKENDKMSCD